MNVQVPSIDFARLDEQGYAVLPGLLSAEIVARFERDITALGRTLCQRRGIETGAEEEIAALLRAAGERRAELFDFIKRLFVLTELASDLGRAMEQAALLRHSRIAIPAIWATLRADLPGETTYTFPLHQDYATTRCATAWRMWIPFRNVDSFYGSMRVVPGSHRRGPYRYVVENTSYPHIEAETIRALGMAAVDLRMAAGDAVLFDPRLVHGSIANRSARSKWVLLLHIQDLATFVDPDDAMDPLQQFLTLTRRPAGG